MPARKPYISQVSLFAYTHTPLQALWGIQEAFPADRHKKGAGLQLEKPAQEKEKKKKALPHPLLFSSLIPPSLSLLPHHPLTSPPGPSSAVLCRLDSRELLMDYGWSICS